MLSKRQVRYRDPGKNAARKCGNCVMFRRGRMPSDRLAGTGRCTLVKGIISDAMVCDRWEARK
jgi:hypothetical protein